MLNRVTAVGFGLGLVASACGSPSSPERPEGLDPRFVSAVGAEGYFDYAAQPCSIVPRDFPRSSSDEMPAPIWTVGTVEHEPIDYGDVIDFGTEDGVQRVEEIAGEVYEQVGPMLTEDYQQDVDPAVKITILGESCKDPKIDEDEGYEMQFNAFAIPPDDTQAGGIEIQAYENNVAPAAVVWMVLAHEWGHHVLYDYFNFDQENPEFNRYVSDEGYADGFFEATYYSIIGSRLPDLQPEIDAIRHDESLSPTQKYGMVAELVSKAVRSFPNESLAIIDGLGVADESRRIAVEAGHPYDNTHEVFASLFSTLLLAPDTLGYQILSQLDVSSAEDARALLRAFTSIMNQQVFEASGGVDYDAARGFVKDNFGSIVIWAIIMSNQIQEVDRELPFAAN